MALDLSQRIQRVRPSATMAVTARAAELRAAGEDVIGLGAGEPDFETPAHIKAAADAAIAAGHTRYTAVEGIIELRQAIVDKLKSDNQLEYETDQVVVSSGAKQCIFNLCQVLLDAGDEVIVPAPYWVSYPDIARLCGARAVDIFAGPGQGFCITAEQLEAAITPATRLLILNSPSNPTGAAYNKERLQELGEVVAVHEHLVVMTDDIYEHIYWGDESFVSFAMANPALLDRTVVVNGVSKAYAMTGWRIGYAAGPTELIGAMKKIQSQSTSSAATPSQHAALAALTGPQDCIAEMTTAFRERHDYVVGALSEMPGVSCRPGDGTFYAFPDMRRVINDRGLDDDIALGEWLLEAAGVALVPGSAFGAPGFMRVSYATDLQTLARAMQRLSSALSGDSAET
ncbi:MAG: pyridoxal phosphate-dependent aminotransferase [Gammaproteobacteria bacterium]|nr:pyridoxal phosphate-dependent aminotransferase [Gammaproteobacteria bacterium]